MFDFGDKKYKYENGWIHELRSANLSDNLCPVLSELQEEFREGGFTEDQLKAILCAIIHGYSYGVMQGKKFKIQEFKRVFQLD
jgi:hypothetical protein